MNKIIPFTKDIEFNTNIYEINSISLEQNLKVEDNEITGEFIISGDYKESDNSIKNEPFIFNIPFNLELDSRFDSNKSKIDIDNFEYELKNDKTLCVNISISINLDEKKEKERKKAKKENTEKNEDIIEIIDDNIENERKENLFKEEINDITPMIKNENEEVTSIFNNFNQSDEKYITYHVHIYREKDDINEIIKKYNITKEELEEYNDLDKITLGSKIIIPNNEQI